MEAFCATHWMELTGMGGLLLLSAFFSGSETAVFSLPHAEISRRRTHDGRVSRALLALAGDPSEFLSTVLFCNMVVNILIFSLSSALSVRLDAVHGPGAALLFSLSCLALVITFGEITPKTIAVSHPERFAAACALPMYVLHRVLWPVRRTLRRVSRAAERLTIRGESRSQHFHRRIKTILKAYMHKGILQEYEGDMIREVLDLPNMRVRECMQPRVDLLLVPENLSAGKVYRRATATGRHHALLYDEALDRVTGTVNLEALFLADRDRPVREAANAPLFLTEFHRANDALQRLKTQPSDIAPVLDEYGALVGAVTTRDILEEIFGAIPDGEKPAPEVEYAGENEYLLSGSLSIRNLRDLLGFSDRLPTGDTVAGLMASALGCLPEPGATATFGRIRLSVESVLRRRVTRVRLTVTEDNGC